MTLKNLGYALIALLVVLAAANVISEMRPARHGEFGRLDLRERQETVTPKYRPMIVHEAEVPDVTPSGGAVALSVPEDATTTPANLSVAPAILPAASSAEFAGRIAGATQGSGVTIVGGPDGVHIEHAATDTAPKLTGGIFRQ